MNVYLETYIWYVGVKVKAFNILRVNKQKNINKSVRLSVDSRFNFFGSEIQIKKNIKANLHFCNLSGDRKPGFLVRQLDNNL